MKYTATISTSTGIINVEVSTDDKSTIKSQVENNGFKNVIVLEVIPITNN